MSPSSSVQQSHGVKRKMPPTFHHLPPQRAKKLKRSWVEVQKIKSKWKAQKRKEGLIPPRPKLEREAEGDAEAAGHSIEKAEEEDMSDSSGSDEREGSEMDQESYEGTADETSEEEQSPHKAVVSTKLRHKQRNNVETQKQTIEDTSLRDLQRMAYSRSSLHTHKSNPLHRHRGAPDSRGGSGTNGGRGRGQGGRGCGQPDMGMRMKAMLEKIKQDYS